MTLSSKVAVSVIAELSSALDLSTASAPLTLNKNVKLTDGSGLNQANLVFSDRRTIAASGSESLDLAGVLVDALGATLTFARVKALLVSAAAGNTNSVLVGGAASNAWATWADAADNEIIVKPGGAFALIAPDASGYAVTASTGDILQIANSGSGTSVTYDIVIIGASS